MNGTGNSNAQLRWYPLREAAQILGTTRDALSKQFERRARRSKDGTTEAELNGVRARKFANRWKVSFSDAWRR